MAVQLDHFIVPSRDQVAAARMLGRLLGVRWAEKGVGPFSPVYVNDGLTLDFINSDEPTLPIHHYCFRVSQPEFDAICSGCRRPAFPIAAPCAVRWTGRSAASTATSTGTSPTGTSGKC